jgi:hypothetical protein
MLLSAIHKLVNSIWNKEELPDQWKESIILPIHKKGTKLTVIIIVGINAINIIRVQNFIEYPPLKVKSVRIGDHQCGF